LVERFLADLNQKLDTIDTSVRERRMDEVHLHVHSIKSSSRQLGAMRLGELAAKIEQTVKGAGDVDVASLQPTIVKLRGMASQTSDAFEQARAA
jgi:HPt (histidine-containing phosphotransfer) domain-containing protein